MTATGGDKKPDAAPAGHASDDQLIMDGRLMVARSGGDEAAVSTAANQLADLRLNQERGDGDSDVPKDGGNDDEDPELWKPHQPLEDCPVCLAPLPINGRDRTYYPCCCKQVCTACNKEHARATAISNAKRVQKELPPQPNSCAFCRVAHPKSNEELLAQVLTRVCKGDPLAIFTYGFDNRDGRYGLPQNEIKAMEFFHQSAELGCVDAIAQLGACYTFGWRVPMDAKRGLKYLKDAARRGDVIARRNLAVYENERGNTHLTIRHSKLAAAAGDPDCMKNVWQLFLCGKVSKAEVEEVLRANKDACDEMKTDDRERYNSYVEAKEGNDEALKQFYEFYYAGKINAKELNAALQSWER